MTAVLVCLGLLAWPMAPPRLIRALPEAARSRRPVGGTVVRFGVPLVGIGAGGSALPLGPAAGISAALLGSTVGALVRSAMLARRRQREADATTSAIRALAREVHAGADLESAIAAVRGAVGAVGSAVLERLAVSAVGDDPSAGPGRRPGAGSGADQVGFALVAAVRLSRRVGVPLAGLLDRLADGVADQRRSEEQRAAAVAGARLSGWVLAGLPLVGVLLGAGMGADPIPVLLSDGIGGVLLVVGTTLLCAGLLWSAHIARPSG